MPHENKMVHPHAQQPGKSKKKKVPKGDYDEDHINASPASKKFGAAEQARGRVRQENDEQRARRLTGHTSSSKERRAIKPKEIRLERVGQKKKSPKEIGGMLRKESKKADTARRKKKFGSAIKKSRAEYESRPDTLGSKVLGHKRYPNEMTEKERLKAGALISAGTLAAGAAVVGGGAAAGAIGRTVAGAATRSAGLQGLAAGQKVRAAAAAAKAAAKKGAQQTGKKVAQQTGKKEVNVGAEKVLARKAARGTKPKSEFGDVSPPKTGATRPKIGGSRPTPSKTPTIKPPMSTRPEFIKASNITTSASRGRAAVMGAAAGSAVGSAGGYVAGKIASKADKKAKRKAKKKRKNK